MDRDNLTPRLERFDTWEHACREFVWHTPERFNLASIIGHHPDAVARLALLEVRCAGVNSYTFGGLDYLSDKFANVLRGCGMRPGDAVATLGGQSAPAVVAHLAAWKLGGVAVPLERHDVTAPFFFGRRDDGAMFLVTDAALPPDFDHLRDRLPALREVFVAGDRSAIKAGDKDFWRKLNEAPASLRPVETEASAPAFLFSLWDLEDGLVWVPYSHGCLLGQLPAFEMVNEFQLGRDTVFWTPESWDSPPALLAMLYPAWYYGCPVVACDVGEAGEEILAVAARRRVTNLMVALAKIDALSQQTARPAPRHLRNIYAMGGVPAPGVFAWARTLGVTLNAGAGQLYEPFVTATCGRWFAPRPGSLGRAAPGLEVEIRDPQNAALPPGQTGEIWLRRPGQSFHHTLHARGRKDADGTLWRD